MIILGTHKLYYILNIRLDSLMMCTYKDEQKYIQLSDYNKFYLPNQSIIFGVKCFQLVIAGFCSVYGYLKIEKDRYIQFKSLIIV